MSVSVSETLELLLKEYPAHIRMLKGAEYAEPNVLRGVLRASPGWTYAGDGVSSPVNHFTAAEAVFCHNQLTYVLFACMAQQGCFEGVPPLDVSVVNGKKFNGILIRDVSFKFRKPFDSAVDFSAEYVVKSSAVRRTSSGVYIVTQNEFGFDGKKASGSSSVVIELSERELYGKPV